MRTLPKPTDDAQALFLRCAAGYIQLKTKALKQRLYSASAAIRAAAERYETAAQSTTLHQIPESDTVDGPGTATKSDMVDLYENKLTRVGSPGRALYDKLLSLPPRGICPLCGQGIVSTLDHHLPKSTFPALAVAPTNLVPSCSNCNFRKLVVRPSCSEDETLHPYFDDFTGEQWLHAVVQESESPTLSFSVHQPEGWTRLRSARAARHLYVFGLPKLYTTYAAEEMVNIKGRLAAEFGRAGRDGVRQFLREEAESRETAHLNSWQTATYWALARSDWFCAVGHTKIGD